MQFRHSFRVQAPLAAVAEFHRHAASMGAITPPPVVVRLQRAPARLNEGDEIAFTLWLGPFPIHWQARVEAVTPTGFVDHQLRGPFQQWVHQHTFRALSPTETAVIDTIDLHFAAAWHWKIVGLGMWLTLPLLFAYRGWKTKRLLARASDPAAAAVTD
ncbi:MAG: hypothetical protein KF832_18845 [Caldilineaceae bacterium]|nr:hypothetical protein [Caldilineaceae bacterium]